MQAGIIAEIEDNGSDALDDFYRTVNSGTDEFGELHQAVQFEEQIDLPGGREAQIGRAAIEDIGEETETDIEGGEIRTYTASTVIVRATDFLYVPGSFAAATSSGGSFVFQLLSDQIGGDVEAVDFDLAGYMEDHPEADQWKVGFYRNVGNAENGIVHGTQLYDDTEFGKVLDSAPKNQVGLEYNHEGYLLKTFVTESGYAEVYQPSDFGTANYIQFVEEQLLTYAEKK